MKTLNYILPTTNCTLTLANGDRIICQDALLTPECTQRTTPGVEEHLEQMHRAGIIYAVPLQATVPLNKSQTPAQIDANGRPI